MIPILILVAIGGVWFIVEQRQKTMAVAKPVSTGITAGIAPPPVSMGSGVTSETADDRYAQAAASTTSSIPVVGPIISSLVNLFAAGHTAAVEQEATTINAALPTFLNDVESTMEALNQGAITPAEAISYLQEAQANYYTTVAGIIQKGGPCKTPNQGSVAGNDQCPINNNSLWRDCASAGDCNASCAVGCGMVEPTITFLTKIINAGGGTFTIPSSPDNGAIQGTPSITITYTKFVPAPPATSLSGFGSTLSSDLNSLHL
jgi:hypothetical protein